METIQVCSSPIGVESLSRPGLLLCQGRGSSCGEAKVLLVSRAKLLHMIPVTYILGSWPANNTATTKGPRNNNPACR